MLEYTYLNSYFQTGLKNLLDRAVLEHEDLTQTRELTQRYLKCDEVPFDFHRRRMSVIVHEVFKGRDLLICKGAVEEVMAVCSSGEMCGDEIELTDDVRARVIAAPDRPERGRLARHRRRRASRCSAIRTRSTASPTRAT